MNLPDLETSRIIGAEFPDSEFIWVETTRSNKPEVIPANTKQDDSWEFICFAPTCEELGEWLMSKNHELFINWGGEEGENWFLAYEGDQVEGWYSSAWKETQARAEAVKLILAQQFLTKGE